MKTRLELAIDEVVSAGEGLRKITPWHGRWAEAVHQLRTVQQMDKAEAVLLADLQDFLDGRESRFSLVRRDGQWVARDGFCVVHGDTLMAAVLAFLEWHEEHS